MSKSPATGQKPRIGIIFSDSINLSNESKNLAYYIGGNLVLTQHAIVHLVGLQPDGSPSAELPNSNRFSVVKPGDSKATEVTGASLSFSHWNELETCHVIIVTVNATENDHCATKLGDILSSRKDVIVFCMQRGVKAGGVLKEKLASRCSSIILECVVGFAVVIHPHLNAYVSTSAAPSIVVERLGKDIAKRATGPCCLVEAAHIDVIYKKVLTAHAWGIVLYENLFALNAITGGSLSFTLSKYRWRMIYAAMIRENYKAFQLAARGGPWKPEFELISSFLTPWVLEMVLAMPGPLFAIAGYLFGLPRGVVGSPATGDLTAGRQTMTTVALMELVQVGAKYESPVRICQRVLDKLQRMEGDIKFAASTACSGFGGTKTASASGNEERMSELEEEIRASGGTPSSTIQEIAYWVSRLLALLSTIAVLYFLFIHD